MSKRVLHVAVDLPYPPHDGGRADVWGRVAAMKELGHHVHLLVMQPKTKPDEAAVTHVSQHVDCLQFVPRQPLLRSMLEKAPTLLARNRTLAHFWVEGTFDIVLAESEHVTPVFENIAAKGAVNVLRMHNQESAYMRCLAASERRLWKKAFFYIESIRYRCCMLAIWRKADRIWAVSAKEYADLQAASSRSQTKARWLPPTLHVVHDFSGRKPVEGSVLFLADLRGPINQEALAWYLDHVHPRLLRLPAYRLIVAGNTSARYSADGSLHILRRILNTNACTLVPDPVRLDNIYDRSAVFINPMRRGAGVKLKTVQAAAAGIPVVSTTVGNEGTGLLPGRHISIADSADDFTAVLEALLANPGTANAMADAALTFVREHYAPHTLEDLIQEAARP